MVDAQAHRESEATLGSLQLGLSELKTDHARLEGKIDVVNANIDGVKGAGKVALWILIPFLVAILGGIMGLLGAIVSIDAPRPIGHSQASNTR